MEERILWECLLGPILIRIFFKHFDWGILCYSVPDVTKVEGILKSELKISIDISVNKIV